MDTAPTRRELRRNLKELRAVLEERPMDLDARMRVARTLRLLKSPDQAIDHYQQVARYLSLAGKPLMAIMVLKELLQVDPKHQETLMFIAKLYARTGQQMGVDVGRVAKPIQTELPERLAMPDGMPEQPKALWNAIQPKPAEEMIRVNDIDDYSAEELDPGEDFILDDTDILEVSPFHADDPATQQQTEEPLTVDEGRKVSKDTLEKVPEASQGKNIAEHFSRVGVPEPGRAILPEVPLFSKLSTDAFIHLIEGVEFKHIPEGELVFAEGDAGDSFVVIVDGEAAVSRQVDGQDVVMSVLRSRDCAGIFGLMAAETRQATLKAQTDLDLLEIKRSVIEDLLHVDPAMREVLADFFRERLVMNLLSILPVFASLPMATREGLVHEFKLVELEEEEDLFFQGADYNGLWVVLQGQVQLIDEMADGDVDVKYTLKAGDYVGSFARADKAEADLGARAVGDVAVAMLTHKSIRQMLINHPNTRATRQAFDEKGLMVSQHVFAGSAKVPGDLAQLNEIFESRRKESD